VAERQANRANAASASIAHSRSSSSVSGERHSPAQILGDYARQRRGHC
jgi:hypothetical protein